MSSECQYQETIFNFLSTHNHKNEITRCEKCNQEKECKVQCFQPKSKILRKICLTCLEIENKERQSKFSNIKDSDFQF